MRMYLTYNQLVISVFTNNTAGVAEALQEVRKQAKHPDYDPVQEAIFYEVAATLLLTAYDRAVVQEAVTLFEEAMALLEKCTSKGCKDALTLAPYYQVMNHATLAEGYAMLGEMGLFQAELDKALKLGKQLNWPYLDDFTAYAKGIDTKYQSVTQVSSPWPNGFKVEQPYMFKHENGCRHCHVGQQEVPEHYLP